MLSSVKVAIVLALGVAIGSNAQLSIVQANGQPLCGITLRGSVLISASWTAPPAVTGLCQLCVTDPSSSGLCLGTPVLLPCQQGSAVFWSPDQTGTGYSVSLQAFATSFTETSSCKFNAIGGNVAGVVCEQAYDMAIAVIAIGTLAAVVSFFVYAFSHLGFQVHPQATTKFSIETAVWVLAAGAIGVVSLAAANIANFDNHYLAAGDVACNNQQSIMGLAIVVVSCALFCALGKFFPILHSTVLGASRSKASKAQGDDVANTVDKLIAELNNYKKQLNGRAAENDEGSLEHHKHHHHHHGKTEEHAAELEEVHVAKSEAPAPAPAPVVAAPVVANAAAEHAPASPEQARAAPQHAPAEQVPAPSAPALPAEAHHADQPAVPPPAEHPESESGEDSSSSSSSSS